MDRKSDTTQIIERGQILLGRTHKVKCGCGNIYVTVNRDKDFRILEVFAVLGKAGGCAASQLESIGRLTTRCLRAGISPDIVMKDLRGNICHSPNYCEGQKISSCSDAIGIVIERELDSEATDNFKIHFEGGEDGGEN